MAKRWICSGGAQPVRVVHGDGQVLSLLPPVTVADILVNHPHHYICHMCPELPTSKSSMLPLDHELEAGYLYFLLPVPRLFPTSSAGPPSCCCRVTNQDTSIQEGHTTPSRDSNDHKFGFPSPLSIKGMQRMMDRIGSPIRAVKKVSPELFRSPISSGREVMSPLLSPTYGSSKVSKLSGGIGPFSRNCRSPKSSPSRSRERSSSPKAHWKGGGMRESSRCVVEDLCKWKPRLGCISETDAVVTVGEELRLCLDRRRLTFDSRLPRSNSPSRLADAYRFPARDRLIRSAKEDGYSNKLGRLMMDDGYNSKPIGHMSLGSYLFV